MKILAIRIKNLASLDGHTEIDFTQEPLRSAGIFAITGPTGAGKSTILDALCLALYAKTPRYKVAENGIDVTDVQGSTIKQDDVRGILRDGTADGFAEADFVGLDEQHYRARWHVRRARDKADGNLQAYDMSLKNLTTHADMPGRKTELLDDITRLIGLNFEQFTRSVMLAQGDFTAFLKAGKNDKSSLLEKLTGTQIYSEISRKIYENHRDQAQKMRELNLRREGIATLTEEEAQALQEEKATLGATKQEQEKHLNALDKEIQWHAQLASLKAGVEAGQQQLEQTQQEQKAATPRRQKLQQVEQVQAVRPVVDKRKEAETQLMAHKEQLQALAEVGAELQTQKAGLDADMEKTAQSLEKETQAWTQAQPLLEEAKKLDIQLAEKREQLNTATEAVEVVREKQKKQQEQLSATQEEVDRVFKTVEALQEWKAGNSARQPIAEQESFILSRLDDAQSILETLQELSGQLEKGTEEGQQQQEQKAELEKEAEALQERMKKSEEELKQLLATIPQSSVSEWEEEKHGIDQAVEEGIAATAHWRMLHQSLTRQVNLQQGLAEHRTTLERHDKELSEVKKQLDTTKTERAASLKMLEKARIAATENVVHLREQLMPGEPCPVCGSTEHPYATENPQMQHLLSELEATYNEVDSRYTQLLQQQSSLAQTCEALQQRMENEESELKTNTQTIGEQEATWKAFHISTETDAIPEADRATWLTEYLAKQKAAQQSLKEKIQAFQQQKTKYEAQKEHLSNEKQAHNALINQIKDVARQMQSGQEQLAKAEKDKEKASAQLEQIKVQLSEYFHSEEWFANWQGNPGTFRQRVHDFADQWKAKTQQLEENLRAQGILQEKLHAAKEQTKSIAEEAREKEQSRFQLQQQFGALSEARKAIFEGKPAAEVEQQWKTSIQALEQEQERHQKRKETLQAEWTRHATQKEQLEQATETLVQEKSDLQDKLEQWLEVFNRQKEESITEAELLSLLAHDVQWIETERAALRKIDDAVTQAQSVWAERAHTLQQHVAQRPSERELEELQKLQHEAKAILEEQNKALHEIDFRLKEDTTNRQRIGKLLKEIDKQATVVDNWAKLNEIIGSADGKKFRQIAQEYTLDVLLSYANVHLEVLTKRYVLQRIPDSLGLQVIDQDMGDEVRTVYSLSGGESFLVSLALALGLASLSSSRMKVESLFIDEGFGSLDPTTLNIAMDALERLHNQGRKVGVISHVQEMTERIPVRINVSKQQSGKSKVEIY